MVRKSGEGVFRLLNRLVLIIRKERYETLCKACEVPLSNAGLIGIGVTPVVTLRLITRIGFHIFQ